MKIGKDNSIEKSYWDEFYKSSTIEIPSQFCVSMATDNHNKKTVVEFGMGNGRDSLYLAALGHIIISVDISESAVISCDNTMQSKNISHATFLCGDISQKEIVEKAIATAREKCHKTHTELIVYSRFVMHSLSQEQENDFLESLSVLLQAGDRVYFEFRSEEDCDTEKYFGNTNHFRRYVDSKQFIKNLQEKYKLDIDYSITGRGMAKYKGEDPVVTRIIAIKSRNDE